MNSYKKIKSDKCVTLSFILQDKITIELSKFNLFGNEFQIEVVGGYAIFNTQQMQRFHFDQNKQDTGTNSWPNKKPYASETLNVMLPHVKINQLLDNQYLIREKTRYFPLLNHDGDEISEDPNNNNNENYLHQQNNIIAYPTYSNNAGVFAWMTDFTPTVQIAQCSMNGIPKFIFGGKQLELNLCYFPIIKTNYFSLYSNLQKIDIGPDPIPVGTTSYNGVNFQTAAGGVYTQNSNQDFYQKQDSLISKNYNITTFWDNISSYQQFNAQNQPGGARQQFAFQQNYVYIILKIYEIN